MSLSFCVLAVAIANLAPTPADPNVLTNGNFMDGVSAWRTAGEVLATAGSHTVELSAAGATISQVYRVPGLRILSLSAKAVASSQGYPANLYLQCFDAQNRLLMDLKQEFGTKNETGIYMKTQAFTDHVLVGVQHAPSSDVPVVLSEIKLEDGDRDRVRHAPEADLQQYMKPIWRGDTVIDETVLLFSQNGQAPAGKLLFKPTEVISVTDSTRRTHYVQGKDYSVSGNAITRLPGSAMPQVSASEVPKDKFPWLSVAGRHVLVTYRHVDQWKGPLASYSGHLLPNTEAKLKSKSPLTVVAFGDSITLGINVSGFRGEVPYTPTWPELFTSELGRRFGDGKITLYNTALGGMTAEWGKDNAKSAVADLHPDLVLIAFGMNDFWSFSAEQFRANTEGMIRTIRAQRPKCEFILVGSMKFDPAYTEDPLYVSKLSEYAEELKALTGAGVALLNMTEMSHALYKAKSAKDLETDPMHPDDFLSRWYAQSVVAMFDPAEQPRRAAPTHRAATNFFVSPQGDDSNRGTSANRPWQTLARVQQEPLVPGDRIELEAGATFRGHLALKDTDAGTPSRPIVIESVGAPAIIVSEDLPALSAQRGGLEFKNLVLDGGAKAKKDAHIGLLLLAKGEVKQAHVRIENVRVSNFGGDGISIKAEKGSHFGFDDLIIRHVQATHNFGTGIISDDGIAFESHGYAHSNFLITDCDVSNNRSGSGMVLCGVDHALVEYCRSSSNLGAGGGVGLWAWCARNLAFRYCIADGTRTNNGGDGGGFDLDGGCVNCVVENCLSYNNDGPGYMHCDYPGAPSTNSNSIRDCVSIDDGRKPKGDSLGFGFVTWGSGLDRCSIERNLAVVTQGDKNYRENGVFFVSFIKGSTAPKDVLHVKGCLVKENVADIGGSGIAFVRDEQPNPKPSDVLFADNLFDSNPPSEFIQTAPKEEAFKTLEQWRATTGEERSHQPSAQTNRLRSQIARWTATYLRLAPRDLPQLFPYS